MSVVTASQFLARFPEFTNVDTTVIEAVLAEVELVVPSSVWGDWQSMGIKHLAAHSLASRLTQMGLQIGAGSQASGTGYQATLYGQEYLRLRDSLPISGFALGGAL